MNEEKLRILRMIEEGKISAEEGARLMDLVDDDTLKQELPHNSIPSGGKAKKIRILVTDIATGQVKTDIRVPTGFLRAGKGLFAEGPIADKLSAEGIDVKDMFSENHVPGDELLNIEDLEDNEKIVITYE